MSGVFISYRRIESKAHAHLIFRELRKAFPGRVFMDVDSLKPGDDFREKIGNQLSKCSVLLALIGPNWTQVRDEHGNPRIHSERDWVRLEISTALQRNIAVIPVLIEGAPLPDEKELPADLKPLLHRHALSLNLDHMLDEGMDVLTRAIQSHSQTTGRIFTSDKILPMLVSAVVVVASIAAVFSRGKKEEVPASPVQIQSPPQPQQTPAPAPQPAQIKNPQEKSAPIKKESTAPTPAVKSPRTASPNTQASSAFNTKTSTASEKSPADPFVYFVQVGAYPSSNEAESQRGRLAIVGVKTRITEKEQAGSIIYRVRVGPLELREDGEKIRDTLAVQGFPEAALVRVPK